MSTGREVEVRELIIIPLINRWFLMPIAKAIGIFSRSEGDEDSGFSRILSGEVVTKLECIYSLTSIILAKLIYFLFHVRWRFAYCHVAIFNAATSSS